MIKHPLQTQVIDADPDDMQTWIDDFVESTAADKSSKVRIVSRPFLERLSAYTANTFLPHVSFVSAKTGLPVPLLQNAHVLDRFSMLPFIYFVSGDKERLWLHTSPAIISAPSSMVVEYRRCCSDAACSWGQTVEWDRDMRGEYVANWELMFSGDPESDAYHMDCRMRRIENVCVRDKIVLQYNAPATDAYVLK